MPISEDKIFLFKMVSASSTLDIYRGRGIRSFHTGSMGSVAQRAAKLLAVKVADLKKKSANPAHCSQSVCKCLQLWVEMDQGRIILKF